MVALNACSSTAREGPDGRVPRRVRVTDIRKCLLKDLSIRGRLCVCVNMFKLEIQVPFVHLSGDS